MTREHRIVEVPVDGGTLCVGVWDAAADDAPTVVLVHGVTSSHLAWQFVADLLPDVRIVAPDLRGRGRSNGVRGAAGMSAHADDLAAVFAHLGIAPTLVVGHSMGGFVAVVFAHRHPELVTRLLLVDGGAPLATPEGLDPDALIEAILGPTAARLSMRFADVDAYLDFWRAHPAFVRDWSPELERYLAYDLVPDGETLRPATSYETTRDDTVDLNAGTALLDALGALRHPADLITVPRGLQDETPGLYPPAHRDALRERYPELRQLELPDLNHYTVVMSERGAEQIVGRIRERLAA
ncbi:alpha/beta fold hydrolase [Microbacterium sp. No. 7]|uniref:alpha/beta fold hydrolase n=1 Tax=Microbacterium sp. No. 7 TaxID=1714373 RepID=UPI0006D02C76|nr:alpha/beta hydrolase [Microbacterium sp. No. 7]ALJ20038.1 alpha/beta hydrolase [Microbacterium sp. No. 7]